MSTFIVADNTINYVVNWLRREEDRLYLFTGKLQKLGFNPSNAGWAERLGYAMFLLNIKAVDARYGKGAAEKFRKFDYRFEHTEAVSFVQVLKSLQCWLYQCSEGAVPETKMYQFFDRDVRLYLMDAIITKLPEYQEAVWG